MLRVWARKIFCIMDLLRSLFDKDRSNLAIAIKTWRPEASNRPSLQSQQNSNWQVLAPQTLCNSKLMTTTTMDAAVIMPGTTASQPPQPKKKTLKSGKHLKPSCWSLPKIHPNEAFRNLWHVIPKLCHMSHICIVCPTSYEGKHAIKTLEQSKLGQQLFESSGLWICPNPVANRCRCWAVRDLLPILPAEMLMHMASLARNLYL